MKKNKVVIVGAGPSGVLASINFLRRGWHVTLVEKSSRKTIHNPRSKSWTVGISEYGTKAFDRVPGLLKHIRTTTLKMTSFDLYAFGRLNQVPVDSELVDRNKVVSVMLEFLDNQVPEATDNLIIMFDTRVMAVDGSKKVVFVESNDSDALKPLSYDLLIGADGSKSAVRNFLFSQNSDFECSQSSIFKSIKSIYITRPKEVRSNTMLLVPSAIRGCPLMTLAAPDNKINFIISIQDDREVDDELLSNDPQVLCDYLNQRLAGVMSVDMDAAKALINTKWYRSQQVKCAPYHLINESAIIIGDAAHATSPALGKGLNTALQDAAVLDELMDLFDENLSIVLPEYSKQRVKVGYAVTELSFNQLQKSGILAFYNLASDLLRRLGNWAFGERWVQLPYSDLGNRGVPMDKVFTAALNQGIYPYTRRFNEDVVWTHHLERIALIPVPAHKIKIHKQRELLTESNMFTLKEE